MKPAEENIDDRHGEDRYGKTGDGEDHHPASVPAEEFLSENEKSVHRPDNDGSDKLGIAVGNVRENNIEPDESEEDGHPQ